jgi:hypothetical protein
MTEAMEIRESRISAAGDPFAGLTASERDKATREHYAPEYRAHLRRLTALKVYDEESE